MSLSDLQNSVRSKGDYDLSHFAFTVNKPEIYTYYRDTEKLTQTEMEMLMETVVRELMQRNLTIPGGGVQSLMAVAHRLAPEFGDKYKS